VRITPRAAVEESPPRTSSEGDEGIGKVVGTGGVN